MKPEDAFEESVGLEAVVEPLAGEILPVHPPGIDSQRRQ